MCVLQWLYGSLNRAYFFYCKINIQHRSNLRVPTHFSFLLQYNLIPKSQYSLKVLAELPIIVVLMYQLYKHHVQTEIPDFIPMIMTTITLQPSPAQRYVVHVHVCAYARDVIGVCPGCSRP